MADTTIFVANTNSSPSCIIIDYNDCGFNSLARSAHLCSYISSSYGWWSRSKSDRANVGGGNGKITEDKLYLGVWGLAPKKREALRSHFRLFYCVTTD